MLGARAGLGGAVVLTWCALLAAATPLRAQRIMGRVLDDARRSPVPGAVVRLLQGDAEKAQAMADSLGRFTLAPPRDGEYVLEAVRLGYETTRSPLLAMTVADHSVPVDLMMSPEPLGIEGVEVTVRDEAARMLAPMGLTPERLGRRWIDREFIESVIMKSDIGSVIRRRSLAGVHVDNADNAHSTIAPLCVRISRAGGCALIVWEGIPISGNEAAGVDPSAFDAAAVLMPMEAQMFWGIRGENGAVLLWTHRGPKR